MRLPFHHALKRLLVDAFSGAEYSSSELAMKALRSVRRPCTRQVGQELLQWLEDRGIRRLVHFTRLENVPKIMQFGLIPREYLEMEAVKLALGSYFSDQVRGEGMPHFSCLSITSPNYSMFFSKRNRLRGDWAVLELDATAVCQLHFVFTPTNAASSGVTPIAGVEGAERLFSRPELRQELNLKPCEPTDPQAESLCDSVLLPEYVRGIFVNSPEARAWLAARDIEAQVGRDYFIPRRDFRYWQGRRLVT